MIFLNKVIVNVLLSSRTVSDIFVRFYKRLIFSSGLINYPKIILYKNPFRGNQIVQCELRDVRTRMTRVLVAFRNFTEDAPFRYLRHPFNYNSLSGTKSVIEGK